MFRYLTMLTVILLTLAHAAVTWAASPEPVVHHRMITVDDVPIFYREAGASNAPVLLLLHGFPTSSHMYRNLIPLLADRYRIIAPDYPGFGFSGTPDRNQFKYTFENLTEITASFTNQVGAKTYAIYMFDYGAPIGFRLALRDPERVTAIISQNGNAYEEGLTPGWDGLKKIWAAPTEENRAKLLGILKPEATKQRYLAGVPDALKSLITPDSAALDDVFLARPGNADLQLDLLIDYQTNVALYPAFQDYLRKHQPPLLAVWGKNDPIFAAAGAEAFKRDLPNAEIHLLDAGHFALETHANEIAALIDDFLGRSLNK